MPVSDPDLAFWLCDSLRSGLVAIDPKGVLVGVNEAALRLVGAGESRADQWLGREAREVLGHQPNLLGLLVDALDGAERPSRAELVLEPEPGVPARTIGFTLVPVRDPAGAVRGAAVLFRDLQPIERMDEQERLRERLAALGQMAAGLAHEIRNPLASIEVLAGLLKRQLPAGSDERQLVDDLLGELRSLAGTVRDSLDFVKPAAPARTALDVAAVVEEALAQCLARVPFEGSVRSDFAPDLPPLLADPDQLRAAVGNLVSNALEAMADRGPEARLEIAVLAREIGRDDRLLRVDRAGVPRAATPASRELVVRVADNGPGVPEELRERIFYPFFTTRESGSGVGLAMAQKLVASHGGSLELEDRDAPGACFRLRIPVEEGAP